jgi:hypothetical protein
MFTFKENTVLYHNVVAWTLKSDVVDLKPFREGIAINCKDGSQYVIGGGPDLDSTYLVQSKFARKY